MDVLKSADWIIEMGPGAGAKGGKIIFEGTPEQLAQSNTPSAPHLASALYKTVPNPELMLAAEASANYVADQTSVSENVIQIFGAREHNLKNISLEIPRNGLTVITGVSGSGKSTLAFDVLFAEGQRRFMESISSYARQFIEQMPRPDIDRVRGIPPTVAIEQRVTHGTRKSTVATITEVAMYLRLLYARLGIQHSPHNDAPVISQSLDALLSTLKKKLESRKQKDTAYLCAPIIRGRKGHHEPAANRCAEMGYELLRCDGEFVSIKNFKRLDRYREHDIEVVTITYNSDIPSDSQLKSQLETALALGKSGCLLVQTSGKTHWLSTERTDPVTGEAYPELDPKNFSWNSPKGWCPTCRGFGHIDAFNNKADEPASSATDSEVSADYFTTTVLCPDCEGKRLNLLSRSVKLHFDTTPPRSLTDLLALTPGELIRQLGDLALDGRGKLIIRDILPQISERLAFMDSVGLGYLTLERPTATLSGGEAQRIRLAAQLGSTLAGVLYILDEPSIGLHARDNARLLDTLDTLKQRGNSLVVVEHNAETMRRADRILDLGPGAGIHGGSIIAHGTLDEILANEQSLTGRYLNNGIVHPLRGNYRTVGKPPRTTRRSIKSTTNWITLVKPSLRNLKGDDLHIAVNRLNVVCGISGAGKSTLIRDLLRPALQTAIKQKNDTLNGKDFADGTLFKNLSGCSHITKVIEVDQEPIGKTPRSTPATYIGSFDTIRNYFATLPEAKICGHTAGSFSFNTKGGRCETCGGAGRIKVEMNFLPDSYIICDDCGGSRYGQELLDIRWNGKNIAEVLEMSFEEAAVFFDFHKTLSSTFKLMCETGLGYLRLGQSSPTLSGGEAQRLKLVSELVKGLPTHQQRKFGIRSPNLYILEEPTIGLHMSDCEKLIGLLHRLVDDGHTVIVIEHHIDIIREADYLIELGPEGGSDGGHILYQGNLDGLKQCSVSRTRDFVF